MNKIWYLRHNKQNQIYKVQKKLIFSLLKSLLINIV